MAIDLTNLPAPAIIEDVNYADIKTERLADFQELEPDYEGFVESDPVVKIIGTEAAGEEKIKLRINDCYLAQYPAFATGTDLDVAVSSAGITRMVMQEEDLSANPPLPEILESDTRLRERYFAKRAGETYRTTGYYKYNALTASPLVADVYVISEDPGEITVYVLSTEDDGLADSELLGTVEDFILADFVNEIGLGINVNAITLENIDLYVKVYLTPDASVNVFTALEDTFIDLFQEHRKIGLNITASWVTKALMQDGVHRVELYSDVGLTTPFEDVVISPSQIGHLDNFALTNSGREY